MGFGAMVQCVTKGPLKPLTDCIKQAASIDEVKYALAEGFRYKDTGNKFRAMRKWFIGYLKSKECKGVAVVGMFKILLAAGQCGSSYVMNNFIIDFVKNADPRDLRNRVCPALEADTVDALMELGKDEMKPLLEAYAM